MVISAVVVNGGIGPMSRAGHRRLKNVSKAIGRDFDFDSVEDHCTFFRAMYFGFGVQTGANILTS